MTASMIDGAIAMTRLLVPLTGAVLLVLVLGVAAWRPKGD